VQKEDFYQRIRKRVQEWAVREGKESRVLKYVLLAPDFFHLMCKLMLDSRVPGKEKAKLGGAIAYFISPVDVLPEGLVGPVGYIDDIALAAYVLNSVLTSVSSEVLKEHWAGEGDLLPQIQEILRVADKLVGSGLWERIKKVLK